MMKRIFLIITAFLFVQCEKLFDGYWEVPVYNTCDRDLIFGIDINIVNGKIYARESYFDPSDEFWDFSRQLHPQRKDFYTFLSKGSKELFLRSEVQIIKGDTVSVYAIDPNDLGRYSRDEIKEKKKYWFARVVIGSGDRTIYFLLS